MKAVVFLGRKTSGKDTCANYIVGTELAGKKVMRIAFANHIKNTLAMMFNVKDTDVFHDQSRKETEKIYGDFTARDLMEWYGKEMRARFGDNFFADIVRMILEDAKENGYDAVVITDMRFICELQMLESFFNSDDIRYFYVNRDEKLGAIPDDAAESEKAVLKTLEYMKQNGINYTEIDNNGSMNCLQQRIYKLVLNF